MADLAESGGLGEALLPRLLLALCAQRFDGELVLARDPQEKRFRFHQGAPVSVETRLERESLAQHLLEAGRISRVDVERVTTAAARNGVGQGQALLESGILGSRDLVAAVRRQVRVCLLECFGWPDGDYTLTAQAPLDGAEPLRADPFALVQEGIEVHWSSERVLSELAPHMSEFVSGHPRLERIRPRLLQDDAVERTLAALDGTRSLWRLVQEAGSRRALAALWLLDAVGGVEYADAKPEVPVDDAGEPEIEIVRAAGEKIAPAAPEVFETSVPEMASDSELALEISSKYVALGELDHYALLGVDREADRALIRRAYLGAAKRFHPDALARAGLDKETRDKAGRVFATIGKAHAVLSDPERRVRYDGSLDGDDNDFDAERLASAETNYRKGEILMKAGNFRGALEFLRAAVELWPEDATYQGALGWALFKAPPSDPLGAREHLERAIEIEPHGVEHREWLGVVLEVLESS